MASVVFSKGYKADSNGLQGGPDGWSELEGEKGDNVLKRAFSNTNSPILPTYPKHS